MINNLKSLMDLGLTENESSIYLSAFKLGGATASQIAKESGLKRTHAYPILKALADKGFVNVYFRKNKRFYYAAKPDKLAIAFEKKLAAFNDLIPMLNSLNQKASGIVGLRFVETANELKQFYLDVLDKYKSKSKTNREYYAIGNSRAWEGVLDDFSQEYREQRAELGIKTKLILSSDSLDNQIPTEGLLRQCKFVEEKYKFKSTIDIFDDEILIVSPQLSSLAVVISVPSMVDVFRSVFEILWEKL